MERRISLRRASKKFNFLDVSSSSSSGRSKESEILDRETIGKRNTIKTFVKGLDIDGLMKKDINKSINGDVAISNNPKQIAKRREKNKQMLDLTRPSYIYSHEFWGKEYYHNVIKLSKLKQIKEMIKQKREKGGKKEKKEEEEKKFQYKINPDLYLNIEKRPGDIRQRRNQVFNIKFCFWLTLVIRKGNLGSLKVISLTLLKK